MIMNSKILIQHLFYIYNLNLFVFVVSYWRESLLIAMSLCGVYKENEVRDPNVEIQVSTTLRGVLRTPPFSMGALPMMGGASYPLSAASKKPAFTGVSSVGA